MGYRFNTLTYNPRYISQPEKHTVRFKRFKNLDTTIGDEMSDSNLKNLDMFDKDDYEQMIELHTEHLENYNAHINYYQRSLAEDALALKEYMNKRDHSNHVLAVAKSRLERLSA